MNKIPFFAVLGNYNCEGNKRTDIFSKLVYLFLCRMRMGKGAELIKMLSNN
jgi:hypothetical protein